MIKRINNFFLFLVVSISFYSCDSDNYKTEPLKIGGEWLIIERTLTTGDNFVDENVNNLFKLSSKEYLLKRFIIPHKDIPDIGVINMHAIDPETGIAEWKRDGTYKLTKDTIYITDPKISDSREGYILGTDILVTHSKVTKKELDVIVSEIGGSPSNIPTGTKGILKMRLARQSLPENI